jgi:lipoprotein-releasing system permease protein
MLNQITALFFKVFLKPFEWQIASRFMGGQRKTSFVFLISLFSMAGVAIGTFALILVLSAMNGFEGEVTEKMMGKDSHMEVKVSENFAQSVHKTDSLRSVLLKDSSIVAGSMFIEAKVGISSKNVNDGIFVYGIEQENSPKVTPLSTQIVAGKFLVDSSERTNASNPKYNGKRYPGILLGTYLRQHLGVALGDLVVVQTFASPGEASAGSAPKKMVQCMVTGIFQTGMYEYDSHLAYTSLEAMQKLLGIQGKVHGIQLRVTDPWQVDEIARRWSFPYWIRKTVNTIPWYGEVVRSPLPYPFGITHWIKKNETMIKWMQIEKLLFGVAVSLIILVAAFNIISSLIMLVIEKTREVGILRAMGVSSNSIRKIFMTVGGSVGVKGTIIGAVAGVALVKAQEAWRFISLPGDVYFLDYFPVSLHWIDVVFIVCGSLAISFLVTLPPALRAAGLNPVQAIRHE